MVQTARGMGVRTEVRQAVGLALANALAACSGGLLVEQQGFMDVTVSAGVIVIGLAALMIGQAILSSPRPLWAVSSVVLGAVVYRVVVAWTLDQGLNPNYVKLVTAASVVVVIAARNSGFRSVAFPWTSRGRQRRRMRHQYYEDDRVSSFV